MGGDGIALPETYRGFAELYGEGDLAVALNVGPLVLQPTTAADVEAAGQGGPNLPIRLRGHKTQQDAWLSGDPRVLATGWGGRSIDLISADQGWGPNQRDFAAISTDLAQRLVAGASRPGYDVGSSGSPQIKETGYGHYLDQTMVDFMFGVGRTRHPTNPFRQDMHDLRNSMRLKNQQLADALDQTVLSPGGDAFDPQYGESYLGKQARAVMRIISREHLLNAPPASCYVMGKGGWDTHSSESGRVLTLQDEVETSLRDQADVGGVVSGMVADLKALGLWDETTITIITEFGRALVPNSSGTEHG